MDGAIDVEDGEYDVAYLPDGRRYRPTTEDQTVQLVATGDTDVQDLQRRLAAYKRRLPNAPATEDAAAFAAETLHWHEQRRWSVRFRRMLGRGK